MTGSASAGIRSELIDELVDLVEKTLEPSRKTKNIDRQTNELSTKMASEFVTIHVDEGSPVRVLVKKVIDDDTFHRPTPPDNELRIYEHLESHPAFAAPRYVGTIGGADPHLVLMAVEGWDLRYQDVDRWVLAARGLGVMHCAFHRDLATLEETGGPPRRSSSEHLAEAKLATAMAQNHHDEAAMILRPLTADYSTIAEELAQHPATLVHGDLAPKNVLIETSMGTERAVFVDWEWGHIGAGTTDLAELVNGLDPEATTRVVDAYVEAARGTALPADEHAIARCIDLAQLQRTMFRIARSHDWQVPGPQVLEWAEHAASVYERL
ncbi:MAG TPA: phosphotransferase [Actinomycetota bacterium]|nr:phosphotransferase [Actinomycetota bacterium]